MGMALDGAGIVDIISFLCSCVAGLTISLLMIQILQRRREALRRQAEVNKALLVQASPSAVTRTQEVLAGLLQMAETLVFPIDQSSVESQEVLPTIQDQLMRSIGQRLVTLTCQVLGCSRAGLALLGTEATTLRPIAITGVRPEYAHTWYTSMDGANLQERVGSSEAVARLRAGEMITIDLTEAPFNQRPSHGAQQLLIAPLLLSHELIGILSLGFARKGQLTSEEEQGLVRAVARLCTLVIERERLLQERAAAQASILALQQAHALKDEFLGIAGHELRTPLTSMKASVQLAKRQLARLQMQEGLQTADNMQLFASMNSQLERADRQVGMLNRLVSDLLDVSRIEAGRLELHPALCDLFSLVCEVVEDLRAVNPNRTIQFTCSVEGEVLVLVDADRLRQVVTNYLTNALKYSESDKPVEVRLTRQETQLRVSVRDEGPGLTEEEQQRIWERFYRVPAIEVKSGTGVGLGLGLYISQSIIARHDGKVGVESAKGQGSTFWFTLPLPA